MDVDGGESARLTLGRRYRRYLPKTYGMRLPHRRAAPPTPEGQAKS
jgi:hypothetical protein